MKSNTRGIVVAVCVASGVLSLSGCTSTNEIDFDFNKLAFWNVEMTPEEQARADSQKEIDDQRQIKAELKLKIAEEIKAEKAAQVRADLETQMRASQSSDELAQENKADALQRKAAAMATLKKNMRDEVLAEMAAEKKAAADEKLRAEETAKKEATEIARIKAEKDAREFTNLSEKEQESVRKLAGEYAESFLKSIDGEDYDDFVKNMAPALVKTVGQKKFNAFSKQVKKAKGDFVRYHYMGELKSGVFVTLVYKAEFEREDSKSKSKSNDESMLRLALAPLDDKYMIWSFSLD